MMTDYPSELPSTETPGLPEVIVDGHKVAAGGREALSEVYEIVNMANLARIRKNLEDRTSKGIAFPYIFSVTSAGEELKLPVISQAVSIINDGPATVLVGINDRINLAPVLANAPYNLNFESHRIEFIYIKCGAGVTATARAVFKA